MDQRGAGVEGTVQCNCKQNTTNIMRVSSISNFAVDDCWVVSITLLHICTQHHDHQPLAFNYAFGKGRNKGRGMGSCSNEGLKSNRWSFQAATAGRLAFLVS